MATKKHRKFRELLLYVARTEGDARCGNTKLYKILFYADFLAYQKLGHSISGQEYQRLANGPAPRQALPVIAQMEEEDLCAWAQRDYFGFPQMKLLALREPRLDEFTAEEIAILHDVIRQLWSLGASEVSELSHRFIGWQLAAEGETIPYSTISLGTPRPPTLREIEHGQRLARELNG